MITANVIHRVFRISIGDQAGTAFAIDIADRQYLVTARHIAGGLAGTSDIGLFQNGSWEALTVTVVGHAPDDIDVSVLAPSRRLTPPNPLPLPADSDGLIYGQDAHFLGFPYDILTKFIFGTDGFPLPLVKRATVSAFDQGAFLLDGHNNPGFSGGPVVFKRHGQPDFRVAAVISGFQAVEEPVLKPGNETDLFYRYNTGIIVAHNIKAATDLIDANSIGLEL